MAGEDLDGSGEAHDEEHGEPGLADEGVIETLLCQGQAVDEHTEQQSAERQRLYPCGEIDSKGTVNSMA